MSAAVAPSVSTISNSLSSMDSKISQKEGSLLARAAVICPPPCASTPYAFWVCFFFATFFKQYLSHPHLLFLRNLKKKKKKKLCTIISEVPPFGLVIRHLGVPHTLTQSPPLCRCDDLTAGVIDHLPKMTSPRSHSRPGTFASSHTLTLLTRLY